MFAQAVRTSEAMQEAAQSRGGALLPAVSGCRVCKTVQVIAAPALSLCKDCGAELTLLGSSEPQGLASMHARGMPEREPRTPH